jgi:hypothetical protein
VVALCGQVLCDDLLLGVILWCDGVCCVGHFGGFVLGGVEGWEGTGLVGGLPGWTEQGQQPRELACWWPSGDPCYRDDLPFLLGPEALDIALILSAPPIPATPGHTDRVQSPALSEA